MSVASARNVLCHYQYDALDLQASCKFIDQDIIQRFYCKSRLATEIQGVLGYSLFQHDDRLLAQRRCEFGKSDSRLLATDLQRSIINLLGAQLHHLAYTAYGHLSHGSGWLSLLGFNGERRDPVTGCYHLGNGYRQFNPVLMRFNSPDSWSPFGEGGLNAYAYCLGDPVNRTDETGHRPGGWLPKAPVKSPVNRTIARPQAASSSASAVASSSFGGQDMKELKRRLANARLSASYRKVSKLSQVIKNNEASLPPQNKYTISDDIRDFESSRQAFDHAKSGFGFAKYPDPNVPHKFIDSQGHILLDVSHFDAAIYYYRNRAANKKINAGNYIQVYKLNIGRAQYIKNFSGIDLMTIRQG